MSAAFEQPLGVQGQLVANSDLSTKQYIAMIATAGKADVAGAAANILGVLQNNPKAGQPASIMYAGITKMVAGAALPTVGTAVQTDASGRAVAGSAPAIGRTLTTASGAGVLVTVQLIPN